MKKLMILTLASALFLPQLSLYANESHHPEKQGSKGASQTQMPTQGGMMKKMKQQMQKMMRQMEEIHKTRDPAKREKLLQEHMQSMHEGMKMMDGEHGSGMMMGEGMHQGSKKMDCSDQKMEKKRVKSGHDHRKSK